MLPEVLSLKNVIDKEKGGSHKMKELWCHAPILGETKRFWQRGQLGKIQIKGGDLNLTRDLKFQGGAEQFS